MLARPSLAVLKRQSMVGRPARLDAIFFWSNRVTSFSWGKWIETSRAFLVSPAILKHCSTGQGQSVVATHKVTAWQALDQAFLAAQ